jgi:hypothetical protein
MIDEDECVVVGERRIGKETEVLEEKTAQCHFVHHKSHIT